MRNTSTALYPNTRHHARNRKTEEFPLGDGNFHKGRLTNGVEMRAAEGKAAYKDCSYGLDQRRKIAQRGFYDGFDKTVQEKPMKKVRHLLRDRGEKALSQPQHGRKDEWVCTCAHVCGAKRRMTPAFAGTSAAVSACREDDGWPCKWRLWMKAKLFPQRLISQQNPFSRQPGESSPS